MSKKVKVHWEWLVSMTIWFMGVLILPYFLKTIQPTWAVAIISGTFVIFGILVRNRLFR